MALEEEKRMEKTKTVHKRLSIRKVKKREISHHNGTVSSWDASLFVYIDKRGGRVYRILCKRRLS